MMYLAKTFLLKKTTYLEYISCVAKNSINIYEMDTKFTQDRRKICGSHKVLCVIRTHNTQFYIKRRGDRLKHYATRAVEVIPCVYGWTS